MPTLPEGSVLAKAVVASEDSAGATASKVYFMKKQAPGFDSSNGDWAYFVGQKTADETKIASAPQTKETLCTSCHNKFKEFDYVKTQDFYKKKSAEAIQVATITRAQVFPDSLLTSFSGYTPVLSGDIAFTSTGHGNVLVKSYLNDVAKNSAIKTNPFPMPEGSIFAKAIVANTSTASANSTKVYFMRKMNAGFDTQNGDWAYGVAEKTNGTLKFSDTLSLKEGLCVSCHVQFKTFDNVKTVDFYLKGGAN